MKSLFFTFVFSSLALPVLQANPATDEADQAKLTQKEIAQAIERHNKGTKKLSLEQDDLSADIQDLLDEQTNPKIVALLSQVEMTMAEATDLLEQTNTDGTTIAIETEIIEKIFDAAKKKNQQSNSGNGKKDMDAMLDMMENMMNGGKDVGKKPGEGKGKGNGSGDGGGGGEGSGSGSGKTGSSDNTDENSVRQVPRNSGSSGATLPREFQKAMDAYNKGAKNTLKK